MASSYRDYIDGFNDLSRLVSEYAQSWAAREHADVMERSRDKLELLSRLSEVEGELKQRTGELDASVRDRLERLGSIIGYLDEYEQKLDRDSLARAKKARREQRRIREQTAREAAIAARIAAETQAELVADTGKDSTGQGTGLEPASLSEAKSRLEAAWQRAASAVPEPDHVPSDIQGLASVTMDSIDDIAKSRLPAPVARLADALRLPFREDKYAKVAENREKLDGLVARATDELAKTKDEMQAVIDEELTGKLSEIAEMDAEMGRRRARASASFRAELKRLLLDGLEDVLSPDGAYAGAAGALGDYMSFAGLAGERRRASAFYPGIAVQDVSAADDGTLDAFLGRLMGDAYGAGRVLVPMALDARGVRPTCVSYYSEHVEGVLPLFSNYALQLMDLFSDVGCDVFLCDSDTKANYAMFAPYAGKSVSVLDGKTGHMRVLADLLDTMDEREGELDETGTEDVFAFNEQADEKMRMKVLFVSSVSRLGYEALSALTMLARRGARTGILVFAGVSTDEFQESGVVSRARAGAVNGLVSLCDRLYMSSSGKLGLGNGMPSLEQMPEVADFAVGDILERAAGDAVISRLDRAIASENEEMREPGTHGSDGNDESLALGSADEDAGGVGEMQLYEIGLDAQAPKTERRKKRKSLKTGASKKRKARGKP